MSPYDDVTPEHAVRAIAAEIEKFSPTLASRERWLVLNKLDLLPEEQQKEVCSKLVEALDWKGPVYNISAIKSEGLKPFCHDIMTWIDAKNEAEADDDLLAEAEQALKAQMQHEARENIEAFKLARTARRRAGIEQEGDEFDDFDDDDEDSAEFIYAE